MFKYLQNQFVCQGSIVVVVNFLCHYSHLYHYSDNPLHDPTPLSYHYLVSGHWAIVRNQGGENGTISVDNIDNQEMTSY